MLLLLQLGLVMSMTVRVLVRVGQRWRDRVRACGPWRGFAAGVRPMLLLLLRVRLMLILLLVLVLAGAPAPNQALKSLRWIRIAPHAAGGLLTGGFHVRAGHLTPAGCRQVNGGSAAAATRPADVTYGGSGRGRGRASTTRNNRGALLRHRHSAAPQRRLQGAILATAAAVGSWLSCNSDTSPVTTVRQEPEPSDRCKG
jgi:hypothetical protein